ncbi:hypothetical protein SAMN05720354_10917 [Nitrosospira sp. Nsp1]|nr:hypothetical protein SAMN05720354_10917 [Nitrosospira sp. Nsp1]
MSNHTPYLQDAETLFRFVLLFLLPFMELSVSGNLSKPFIRLTSTAVPKALRLAAAAKQYSVN